ncbi:MAG: hypothetical protein GXP29_04610, partial [Planctomycetes bacterium]|nr:hypothetical protein [Planctomycetota bacterium]
MFGKGKMDNPMNWSFRIGQLFGISIRLHIIFVFGALYLFADAFRKADESLGTSGVFDALGSIVILFAIVLLHEFGHCWGARKSGGEADEVLLWPLGGLASVRPPHTPSAHMLTTVSGPMVNVIICTVAATVLVLLGGWGAVPWNPLHTFVPIDLNIDFNDAFQRWLRMVFGLSYVILLFNLMPVYPFDGGRILHAYLWPKKGFVKATLTATFIGMIGAIVLGITGIFSETMMMIMIAVFGYITCYTDRQMAKAQLLDGANEFGYDFSGGYTSLATNEEAEPSEPGYFERRRQAKEEARERREQEDL